MIYPALLVAAGAAALLLLWPPGADDPTLHQVYGHLLPAYTEALFQRRTAATGASTPEDLLARLVQSLPADRQLRGVVRQALQGAAEPLSPDPLHRRFARANETLQMRGLGLYLDPRILTGPCYLMDGSPVRASDLRGELEPRSCRAVMILPYQIRRAWRYRHQKTTYPVLVLERVDRRPVARGALGITSRRSRGSRVFADQVRRFALDRLVPAASRFSRPILPLRIERHVLREEVIRPVRLTLMSLYSSAEYGRLQRLAAGLSSGDARTLGQLTSSDKEPRSFPARRWLREALGWPDAAARRRELRGMVRDLLPLLLARLSHVVAIHEVLHQIHNRGWTPPAWAGRTVRRCLVPPAHTASPPATDPFTEVFADETAAYLTQLALGRGLRGVTIVQLLLFATDELQQGTPASLAGHRILSSLAGGDPTGCPTVKAAVGHYRTLGRVTGWDDRRLGRAARRAYQRLFEEAVPEIRRISQKRPRSPGER